MIRRRPVRDARGGHCPVQYWRATFAQATCRAIASSAPLAAVVNKDLKRPGRLNVATALLALFRRPTPIGPRLAASGQSHRATLVHPQGRLSLKGK